MMLRSNKPCRQYGFFTKSFAFPGLFSWQCKNHQNTLPSLNETPTGQRHFYGMAHGTGNAEINRPITVATIP